MENASTGVHNKNKEQYLRCKDKAKNIIWCIKTYTIAYVKIKQKWRFTVHYVKPTAQLLFKSRFPKKMDQHAGGKWLIHDTKRRKDN